MGADQGGGGGFKLFCQKFSFFKENKADAFHMSDSLTNYLDFDQEQITKITFWNG